MVWWIILIILFVSLIIFLLSGFPVAFSFMLLNVIGVLWFWGGSAGFRQLILGIDCSLTSFTLVPIVLFVLMGEIMMHSGIGLKCMDVLDKWKGGFQEGWRCFLLPREHFFRRSAALLWPVLRCLVQS